MRKITFAALLYVAFMGVGLAGAPTAETARTAGDIKGSINICSLLGIDRVVAYIPGRSFMLRPATDGSFEFNFVPPGTYQIEFSAETGEIVSTLSGVVVEAKQATDLGEVSICIDADEDGFDATQDCNDGDSSINPDATEICNLVDDNCDTFIDEGFPTLIYYRDADSDTWGDFNNSVERCEMPSGYVDHSGDCYDDNPQAYPGQGAFFSYSRGDGSFDYNCNNIEEKRYFGGRYCIVDIPSYPNGTCKTVGTGFWVSSSAGLDSEPDCGETDSQHFGCRREWGGPFNIELTCHNRGVSTAQQCK